MSRMVGGTFGVAAMGALDHRASASAGSTTCCPSLPGRQRDRLAESLGAGGAVGCPSGRARPPQEAFVYALNNGLRIAALMAALGARSPGC